MFRHTCYNLIGLGLPLVAAIATIPVLIEALGVERFGMLALIWALVSYFGLFDMGLGRALTRELVDRRTRGDVATARRLAATALGAMGWLGIVAGVLLALGAPWLVGQFDGVSDPGEAVRAVYAMAPALPFVVMTSGLRGVLEAEHAFGIVNAIRLPMGIYTFVAPLAVVHYCQNDLGLIAASLTAGRVIAYCVHAWYCRHAIDGVAGWGRIDRTLLRGLLRSGGWITVSNVINPLMGYMDRYVIGLTISVAAVAYYATPYEIITKLWIIPGALTAVLFPRFARASAGDALPGRDLFRRAVVLLFVGIYPIALAIALFSGELLRVWLGVEFAARSTALLQVFAFGILINCLAHVPFTFLQGIGRADISARIHASELPVFLLLLWVLANNYGLEGAVVAWLIRMVADALLLFYAAGRRMEARSERFTGWQLLIILLFAAASFGAVYVVHPGTRALLWMASVSTGYLLCWRFWLKRADRAAVLQSLFHVGV